MTHRNLAHWIALVACINSAIVFLPTRGDEIESVIPANPTDSSNQPDDGKLPPALKEIISIRELFSPRLIGERILDRPDTPAGNEPGQDSASIETEFREALRKISASEPALSPVIQPWRGNDWFLERQSERDSLVAALRQAGDQLARESQRLEAEQRFERARELRKLAKRIRKEMRLYAELANSHE